MSCKEHARTCRFRQVGAPFKSKVATYIAKLSPWPSPIPVPSPEPEAVRDHPFASTPRPLRSADLRSLPPLKELAARSFAAALAADPAAHIEALRTFPGDYVATILRSMPCMCASRPTARWRFLLFFALP